MLCHVFWSQVEYKIVCFISLSVRTLQFSLKENLVSNGYSLIAEKVISKPHYTEEFIKSFQFSL